MTEHTPGPWSVDRDSMRNTETLSYAAINGEGWDELATVVVRMRLQGEDSPEGLANARLIAAAPELLAALEAMHACHRAFSDSENWTVLDDEARLLAEKAIAKAKGEA